MKYKIGLWAFMGFLVAGGWALYAVITEPPALTSANPRVLLLAEITCPIGFVSIYFHFAVSLYACLAANAATYALLGLAVETVRRRLRTAHIA